METNVCQLAKNIKYLRTAFGESQLDLALVLGLESPNAIANYEKGIRNPKADIRRMISKHYRITEDELMYTDFSSLHFSNLQFDNKDKMMDLTLSMLPIMYSEKAMEDVQFKKGYTAHMNAIESMKEGHEINYADFEVCIDSYFDSSDSRKIPESLANILWWIVFFEITVNNPKIIDGAKALQEKRVNNKDFLKLFYLMNKDDDEVYFSEEYSQYELEDLNQIILELLKELKAYTEWSDLVDYYIALRYATGCINNEMTIEMNRAVGNEMMWTFMQIGNPHAKKFISKSMEFFRR